VNKGYFTGERHWQTGRFQVAEEVVVDAIVHAYVKPKRKE
jgi:hypothetical protein